MTSCTSSLIPFSLFSSSFAVLRCFVSFSSSATKMPVGDHQVILMRAGCVPTQAELSVPLDDSGPSVSAPVSASTISTGSFPSIPFDWATIRRY